MVANYFDSQLLAITSIVWRGYVLSCEVFAYHIYAYARKVARERRPHFRRETSSRQARHLWKGYPISARDIPQMTEELFGVH